MVEIDYNIDERVRCLEVPDGDRVSDPVVPLDTALAQG
jgi:hypothetical protein